MVSRSITVTEDPRQENRWGSWHVARGVVAPVELPAPAGDGQIYVTTVTAAKLMHVANCTITSWRNKGYLKPVPGSPPRRPLYLWDDVKAAELKARSMAIEASGTDIQVRRLRGLLP